MPSLIPKIAASAVALTDYLKMSACIEMRRCYISPLDKEAPEYSLILLTGCLDPRRNLRNIQGHRSCKKGAFFCPRAEGKCRFSPSGALSRDDIQTTGTLRRHDWRIHHTISAFQAKTETLQAYQSECFQSNLYTRKANTLHSAKCRVLSSN